MGCGGRHGLGRQLRFDNIGAVEYAGELLEREHARQPGELEVNKVRAFVGRPIIALGRVGDDLVVDDATRQRSPAGRDLMYEKLTVPVFLDDVAAVARQHGVSDEVGLRDVVEDAQDLPRIEIVDRDRLRRDRRHH